MALLARAVQGSLLTGSYRAKINLPSFPAPAV
jgi:hypothetical protein